jgi:hypothetical protein
MKDIRNGIIPAYAKHPLYYHQYEVFIKLSFLNKPIYINL